MTDIYMDKLDLILTKLYALEAKISGLPVAPPTPPAPVQTGGLFRYVRPAVRDISQWPVNVDMTSADADEAFQRSLHGVNWRGGHLGDGMYEEAWGEIEALKRADDNDPVGHKFIDNYRDLDPEFVGFGLLTNLFGPTKYDAASFGVAQSHRKAWAGYTIQSFMDSQIAIAQGGARPSGGED